jgi:hypothetical protein
MPPKRRLIFTGLHGIISQETKLFIATAVRTLNATLLVLIIIADLRISGGIQLNSKGRRKRFPSGQCSDCGLLGCDI